MDDKPCYCRNPQCILYSRMAPYVRLKFRGWHRHGARLRRQVCTMLVSARTGTAYAAIRTDAPHTCAGQRPWRKVGVSGPLNGC
jgi:hypothetical protein